MSAPAPTPPLGAAALLPGTGRLANRAWLVAAALVLGVATLFYLHRPSAESLFELWRDTGKTTYTHGFVIAALAAWLIVRRRARLAALAWQPEPRLLLVFVPVAFAWLVAVRAGIDLINQVLLLAILWLSVGVVAGVRFMRELTVPVGFLVFAVPVWDQINGLLQSVTVVAVTFLLKVAGVPAFVDGNVVHLAVGVFEVEGGCSGLHFFIVGLTLATLYGELGNDRVRERVMFVALAAGLAMISNWLRVTIIVIAGHLTNMQHYLVRVEHYWFGWGMFALTMVAFLLIARRIAPAREAAVPEAPLTAQGSPLRWAAIGAVCVCTAPLFEMARPVAAAELPATRLPSDAHGWHREAATFAWTPTLAGVDRIERATFADANGARVQLLTAEYAEQKQNKELVSYGNELIPRAEGRVVSAAALATGRGRELVVANDSGRAVVRYVYVVGGRRTARDMVEQFTYGLAALRGPTLSAVVAVRAACAVDDCSDARHMLDAFARSFGTDIPGGTS